MIVLGSTGTGSTEVVGEGATNALNGRTVRSRGELGELSVVHCLSKNANAVRAHTDERQRRHAAGRRRLVGSALVTNVVLASEHAAVLRVLIVSVEQVDGDMRVGVRLRRSARSAVEQLNDMNPLRTRYIVPHLRYDRLDLLDRSLVYRPMCRRCEWYRVLFTDKPAQFIIL
jgi:hypothetical protein